MYRINSRMLRLSLFSTLTLAAVLWPVSAFAGTYTVGVECSGGYCNGTVTNEESGEVTYTEPRRNGRRALRDALKLAKDMSEEGDSVVANDEACELLNMSPCLF